MGALKGWEKMKVFKNDRDKKPIKKKNSREKRAVKTGENLKTLLLFVFFFF